MRSRFLPGLVTLFALLAGPLLAQAPPKSAPKPGASSLAAADGAYERKSYALALRHYREAVRRQQVPSARKPEVDYRIVRALGRTEAWDAAFAAAHRLTAAYPGGIWEARGRAWLMELYLRAPHEVWKVGNAFHRTEDAPDTDAEAPPVQVDIQEDDERKAVAQGEQARALYEKLRAARKDWAEEADLCADLARVIAATALDDWAGPRRWAPPADEVWKLDPAALYDAAWAPPKKVLQLYLDAERLGNPAQKPLARLAQAIWLRGYHRRMQQFAREAKEGDGEGPGKPIPYPYQNRYPHEILRSLIKDFPTHPEADHSRILVAEWLLEDGKPGAALDAYRLNLKDRPDNKWSGTARAGIEQITRPELGVQTPGVQLPGVLARLRLRARNIERVRFTARRVNLEELVRDGRVLPRADADLSEMLRLLGNRAGLQKFHRGEPVTWEAKLTESGSYEPVDRSLETPLRDNGAYLLETEGGPLRRTTLVVISDLAVVQLVERDTAHALVVNAVTGAPVAEASTLIREVYHPAEGDQNRPKVSAVTATSDADGMAQKPLAPGRAYSADVRTFAWKGDRYALTSGGYGYLPRGGAAREEKAYVYTERPVYRPGQTVHYRALLAAAGQDGVLKPDRGRALMIRVTDPRGAEIADHRVETGAFGSAHGQVELASEPPLGEYGIVLAGADGKEVLGRGSFRVEEYKKPEFEVTVKGPEGPTRVGDRLTGTISARYYFGAPVAGAKVRYRVHRSEWVPENPFPEPYSFLYSTPGERPRRRGEWSRLPRREVIEGEATTDAAGQVAVTFETKLDDPRFRDRHLRFTVEAEVTDASRRTISGSGEIRALASQFNAFLKVRRGFCSVGDHLQADVRVLDAGNRPVAVEGAARVFRVTTKDGMRQEQEVFKKSLRTDAQGRAELDWRADQPGRYEVRFEARDGWEQPVIAREEAWVAGDAGPGVTHNGAAVLVPEQTTYRLGQTAKVLLIADEPETNVLLTQEAADRILEKRVVRMSVPSMVLEIPLRREQSPDVVLAVTGMRDGKLFRSEAHLYVPPAEQLLTMEVSADKSDYEPGEKATLRIRARDVDGKGVRTEASIGVVDASVFHIAGDSTPSIAPFFYAGQRGSTLKPLGSRELSIYPIPEGDRPHLRGEIRSWRYPSGLGRLDLGVLDGFYSEFDTGLARERGIMLAARAPIMDARGRPSFAEGAQSGEGLLGYPLDNSLIVEKKRKGEGGAPGVRSNFADTAFWSPAVVTDEQGEATVEVRWPDNLTQWRATTRGWTQQAQVGEATTEVTTSKDLLVRLQAPRFFVERDEVVLSANVHNYTGADQRVRVQLQLEGDTLYPASSSPSGPPRPRPLSIPRADRPAPGTSEEPETPLRDEALEQWVEVPKDGEKRLDWRVRVERPGDAVVRVLADSGEETDGVELTFPVYTHGVEKLVVRGGSMLMASGEKPGAKSAKLTVDLPVERATDSGELIVQVNPSVAAAMLDALPYVVDYPYGCVEQTMSRFLPSVVCAKTLTDLGLSLEDLRNKSLAEYERIKAQSPRDRREKSGYSYPEGTPGLRSVEQMAVNTWEWRARKSPVFNPDVLKKMVAEGLARLQRFQNRDGGWGWWQNDSSDPQMTAYVVQGLIAGKAAGMTPGGEMLPRGLAFLDKAFAKEADVHDLAYLGWVLSFDPARARRIAPVLVSRAYGKREKLSAYSLALLALALHQSGRLPEAKVCLENLENTAKVDTSAGTCSWSRAQRWWEWYNSPVETSAACLRAFNRIAPKHKLAPMIVRWLSNRRSGDAWSSTRDTALAVQALAEYVKINRELAPDYKVTVDVGGQYARTFTVNTQNALLFDNRLIVPAPALGNGTQTITVTREGQGNLYYSAYLRYFSLEEGIEATGNEIRVRRRYFRLTKPGSKDALTEDGYVRSLIRPGQQLTSGDLVEVELLIESKNDYNHLVFEDMKPAGCEPVDLQSGSRYGGGLCSNMELRDEKVAFFITHLPQGRRTLTYRLRAELPGAFHALPLNGYAMYAPEVRCISDEEGFSIEDAPAAPSARR